MDTFASAPPFFYVDGDASHATSLPTSTTLASKFAAASPRAVELYMLEREARIGQEIWDRQQSTPVGQVAPVESIPCGEAHLEASLSSSVPVDADAIRQARAITGRRQVADSLASASADSVTAVLSQPTSDSASTGQVIIIPYRP